jgi:LysM repeat protein
VYVVVRLDTLSSIISRYLLDIDVLRALNPGRLDNPDLVVVGQRIYLGRDPMARLEACPGGEACTLYVVAPGESLAAIADRYLVTRDAILAANPGLERPVQPGQVIKLPRVATT